MSRSLTPADFGDRFTATVRVLWTTASGVLGDDSAAEDILQEACVIGLKKLDQFDPDTSFTAWMGRIVCFVALNHLRARGLRKSRSEGAGPLEALALADGPSPPGTVGPGAQGEAIGEDRGHFDDGLTAALSDLTPTARACLLLKTLDDLPYAEIGAVLGIPEGTAASHVHRSRVQLRRRLAAEPDARNIAP